jgi:hypothetical protein
MSALPPIATAKADITETFRASATSFRAGVGADNDFFRTKKFVPLALTPARFK